MLIPLGFYTGHPEQKEQFSNTVSGSFTGKNQEDYAVLAVKRGAIDDSCSLWVFPSGDTLATLLVEKHKGNFYAGTQWWPQYGKTSPLGFALYIRPMSQEWVANSKKYAVDSHDFSVVTKKDFPKVTHEGIHLGVVDKAGGLFYYYSVLSG